MTIHRSFSVLASALLLLALVACGGGGSEPAADDAAAAEGGGAQTVAIEGNAYSPADLSVSSGGSVEWTNNDDVPHTVTFEDSSVSSSDELAKGGTHSATFSEAGDFSYTCKIHPDMKGTVTVS